MMQIKKYLSTVVGIVILAASLLPALHVFNHEIYADNDTALTQKLSKKSVDCEICDFRIANAYEPPLFLYEVPSLQKVTSCSFSLAETVNLFPKPYFSLRAPPVSIS